MKKVAVVATEKDYGIFLRNNIEKYLGKYAKFKEYSMMEMQRINALQEDIVLISGFNIFQSVKPKLKSSSKLIVLSVTLNKPLTEKLKDVETGTRALLVNFDIRSCINTITNLHAAGFENIEFIPYYPGVEYDKSIKLAITPNDAHLVPEEIEVILDIGEGIVDINCIFDIAEALGVTNLFTSNEMMKAKENYYFTNSNMERLLGENENLSGGIETLIKLMKQGIIITDVAGKILQANKKAEVILRGRTDMLIGFNIGEILPELNGNDSSSYRRNILSASKSFEKLIEIGGRNLMVSSVAITVENEVNGSVITLDDFEEVENKQHGISSKLAGTNNEAKYTFDDIKGKSKEIKDTIAIARRMSKTDFSVLITGESGTGKEVFAQSIHNESKRKNYNFVAINCAAIPENLLESEMFGYEEGSFTGAKKGGKIGYFELAHKGTIFLDEIGEMPLSLQAKLLRVIEEKKVVSVGAHRGIDVDVRIIAATNKNLFQMVEKGKFREDLFYRINVLPLQLPSLRERTADIQILLEYFMDKNAESFVISDEVKNILSVYPWRGNVRELRNLVEYMTSLDKSEIGQEDLSPIQKYWIQNDMSNGNEERCYWKVTNNPERSYIKSVDFSSIEAKFILSEGKKIKIYRFILEKLSNAFYEKKRLGRSSLERLASENNLCYTEAELRTCLKRLDDFGFIRVGRGRTGSVITEDGSKFFEKIRNQETFTIVTNG